ALRRPPAARIGLVRTIPRGCTAPIECRHQRSAVGASRVEPMLDRYFSGSTRIVAGFPLPAAGRVLPAAWHLIVSSTTYRPPVGSDIAVEPTAHSVRCAPA